MREDWLRDKAWLTGQGLALIFLPRSNPCISDSDLLLLILRYGLYGTRPRTLQELAKRRNVTKERVRQIVCENMRILKYPARREWMEAFVKHWQGDENPG